MQRSVMEKELGGVLGAPKESELERQNMLRGEKNLPILRRDLARSNEWLEDNLEQVNSTIEGKELHYDGYPIIWRFYTRILPVKIALAELARMMMEKGRKQRTQTMSH